MGPGAQIALQGGIDIGSGIIGNLFQKRNIKLQKEANLELANFAYGKDQEMWHMQNLYNSPKSQMQRFQQAGLNPNLIYGKGTAGNAQAMPKRQSVQQSLHTTKMPRLDVVQQYQNLATQVAQRDNIKANTDLTNQNNLNQKAVTSINMIDAELKRAERDYLQSGTINIYDGKGRKQFNTLEGQLKTKNDRIMEAYNLDIKKKALLDAQINNALQSLLTEQRKYRWMPWEKGFRMASDTAKTAVGARIGSKFIKGKAPKLSTTKRWSFGNSMGPNRKF